MWFFDNLIFQAIGPLVRWWCQFTGTSNFTLARLLLFFSWVLIAIFFAMKLREKNVLVYAQVVVFLTITWVSLVRTKFIEDQIERYRNSNTLPATVYALLPGTRFVRLVFLAIWLLNLTAYFIEDDPPSLLIAHASLVQGIHYYVLYHFNTGGGKIVRRLLNLVKRSTVAPQSH